MCLGLFILWSVDIQTQNKSFQIFCFAFKSQIVIQKQDFPHAILKFLFYLVWAVLFVGKHGKAEDSPAGM